MVNINLTPQKKPILQLRLLFRLRQGKLIRNLCYQAFRLSNLEPLSSVSIRLCTFPWPHQPACVVLAPPSGFGPEWSAGNSNNNLVIVYWCTLVLCVVWWFFKWRSLLSRYMWWSPDFWAPFSSYHRTSSVVMWSSRNHGSGLFWQHEGDLCKIRQVV